MQELLLVNPRKRRKGAKRRSAAQRAATKRMLAANRSRRANPAPKRRKRRAAAKASTVARVTRRTTRRAARRTTRRSTAGGISFTAVARKPLAVLQPALIGAIGAVGVNTFMSRVVPRILPANMQAQFMTGRARYLTQGLAAIGLAMIAQKVGVKAAMAGKMAEGSLTVTMADAIRDVAGQAGIQLGGMGYYLPGRRASPPSRGAASAPQVGNVSAMNGMGLYVTGPGSNVRQMPARAGMGFGTGRTF